MERVLPTRRRKKADSGKSIRVSKAVYETLDKSRKRHSWDRFFRRMLGLPTRKGSAQPLFEGMLEVHSGLLILRMPDVTWREVEELAGLLATRNAALTKIKRQDPVRMREIR